MTTATLTRSKAHGKAAGHLNEEAFIEIWVAEHALSGHTRLDPTPIITTIYEDRLTYGAPDPRQTRDYVLHCVRLAPHVCRHAVYDGVYATHEAPECSPACKEAWAQSAKVRAGASTGPQCGVCFTTVTPAGTCMC